MKSIIFITLLLCAILNIYAQEPADALRYSWITQSGTARNQAIGGASASLGGEFSTIFMNPAGLAFYKTNEFVITPYYNMDKSKSAYKNTLANDKKNNLNLSASGFIFSLPSYRNSGIRNFTIGLGINRTADFNSNVYYKGLNNKSSYSEKYLEELVNNNVTDPNRAATDFPNGASLAFNTYLIDTVKGSNGQVTGYRSVTLPAAGLLQENTITSTGGITDLALAGAVNLRDKLFFGGTISVPVLNYNRNTHYKESDATNTIKNFNSFDVNETLQSKGYGINVKAGVIYKPVEYVRLGLTVHSPTFYNLADKYTTEVITDLEGYGGAGIKRQSSKDFNNGNPGEFKYNLITPWRVAASASYVFREVENVKKQRAFITADIEYVNYKAANYKVVDNTDANSKDYFTELNKTIDDQYKSAFNLRLGGELKYNTIMFRLGGAYYGNPYKTEKADRFKIAGGLGYRDKGIFVDLTYVYAMNKDVNYPYRLDAKTNDPAFVKNNAGNIVATLGLKF